MRALLVGLGLLVAVPGCAAAPDDVPLRLSDGRVLNMWCAGDGAPLVVLDAGWGATSRAWARVMAPLAKDMRMCAMDRAGAGNSDAGPMPRNGAAVATDLAAALRAMGEVGPVILVGHSLGALNMRQFAMDFPKQVAAMVLVDPSVPGAGSVAPIVARAQRCLTAVSAGPVPADDPVLGRCRVEPEARGVDRWAARLSEIVEMEGSTARALGGQAPASLDVPLVVLSAGQGRAGATGLMWMNLHARVAAISSRGAVRLVAQSGHLMMMDAPDAVIAAVRDVAAQHRQLQNPPPATR